MHKWPVPDRTKIALGAGLVLIKFLMIENQELLMTAAPVTRLNGRMDLSEPGGVLLATGNGS